MSLSVHACVEDEAAKMVWLDPEASETLAGPEIWRTKVYGSELAKSMGLTLLPTLAVQDIYATGSDVNKLKAEAEVLMNAAAAFAEETRLGADNIHERANNIRLACIRARHAYGGCVVIW